MGARIREIFSSVQGEGPYVGCRQVFIRFEGCNLSCRYCDTLTGEQAGACLLERIPGERSFEEVPNPLLAGDLAGILKNRFALPRHHSVSLTGGEPLLHRDFLVDLLPSLREMGPMIYLETNGSLPDRLEAVVGLVDIVSMDIKLPGTAGCGPLWDRHLQFLSVARRANVFVKIVMDDASSPGEFERAVDLVAGVDPGITLVIQPLTAEGRCSLSPVRALQLQAVALKSLRDVRVIPQAHKMMDQL